MQFAILISVLIAVILSAFLLLTHVHSFFRIKSKEILQAFEESNTLLFASLENNTITEDTITTTVDHKTTKQILKYHGAWLKRYASVSMHNRKVIKMMYTGSKRSDNTPNFYIEDTNSPIVVAGNTRLEGNSYLPKQGIKAGTISGNYYQGSALHYGRILKSKTTLPELDSNWIKYLNTIVKGSYIDQKGLIDLKKELRNSFQNPTQIIYDFAPIFLEDHKISGNIIIQSKTKIVVTATSQLTDVILIAPKIIIKNNVKGRFQGIATKNIEVGKKCHLSYPSSLILLDQKVISENTHNNQVRYTKPDFILDEGTVIDGTVVYLNDHKTKKNRINPHLAIAPNVTVVGEVYCQGNIDFQGTILGSLYARQCIARQSGSVYLNHVYNGKILINPIDDYAGLPFVNSENDIAKWLY